VVGKDSSITSKAKTYEVVDDWNQQFKGLFPGSQVNALELEAGPPVGVPVVVRIYGDDMQTLRQLSQEVKEAAIHYQ
jgi:Cu/Ag efflux pump CusA